MMRYYRLRLFCALAQRLLDAEDQVAVACVLLIGLHIEPCRCHRSDCRNWIVEALQFGAREFLEQTLRPVASPRADEMN